MKNNIMLILIIATVIEIRAEVISYESVSNTTDLVSYLNQFQFSGTNISSYAEANFDNRLHGIRMILQKDFISADTNAVFAIADYLAAGTPISVSNYHNEIVAAHKHDRFIEFGDSNYVIRAGGGHFGPTARACRDQYNYRRAYNSALQDFRRIILKDLLWEMGCPRWENVSLEACNALWSEFKRRMNATAEETQGLPETIGEADRKSAE